MLSLQRLKRSFLISPPTPGPALPLQQMGEQTWRSRGKRSKVHFRPRIRSGVSTSSEVPYDCPQARRRVTSQAERAFVPILCSQTGHPSCHLKSIKHPDRYGLVATERSWEWHA